MTKDMHEQAELVSHYIIATTSLKVWFVGPFTYVEDAIAWGEDSFEPQQDSVAQIHWNVVSLFGRAESNVIPIYTPGDEYHPENKGLTT